MARIAILTPDPGDEAHGGRWPEVLEREAAPLRRLGHEVEGVAWTSAAGLGGFDLVLPLLAWGYHRLQERWLEETRVWESQRIPLWNPPSVLRWNADKSYLGRLAERGAPVVPTLYVERVDDSVLAGAAAELGSTAVVAKPLASSTAFRTIRWPRDAAAEGPEGAAMVQPYLESIESVGELSLIYFDSRFSHAVRKVPQAGDFRVQPEFDGIITAHVPSAAERAAAEAVLAAVDEPLLYARIDLVFGRGGMPELMELEAIEPDLYLGFDPGRGASFAGALAARIG
jgi:glutathione synthase/RimK-type ligase-like ATP-grasp enzyme